MSTNTKKIFVTSVEHTNVKITVDKYGERDTAVSAFWTFNNNISIHVHYFVIEGKTSTYKSVVISPFLGFDNKTYTEVQTTLEHAMKAVRAWVLPRTDKYDWRISIRL